MAKKRFPLTRIHCLTFFIRRLINTPKEGGKESGLNLFRLCKKRKEKSAACELDA